MRHTLKAWIWDGTEETAEKIVDGLEVVALLGEVDRHGPELILADPDTWEELGRASIGQYVMIGADYGIHVWSREAFEMVYERVE